MDLLPRRVSSNARITHERLGRGLAGASLLVSLALGWLLHPLWLIGAAATAANLIVSALTDRCAVRSLLVRLGFPGERDLGRAEAMLEHGNTEIAKRTRPASWLVRRRSWRASVPLN